MLLSKMKLYLKKQLSIAFILYLGQLMVGYALGWTAPLMEKLEDPDQSPLPNEISPNSASLVASIVFIGSFIGPYISSYIADTKGRKPCFIFSGILNILAYILLAFANNLAMILVGRFLSGMGIGIIIVMNFVYIGEMASTNIRGILLTGTGIFTTLGTLVVYTIGPFISYRATNYVAIGITALYVLGLIVVPESPMFYILKGREEDAMNVLRDIGRSGDIDTLISVKEEKRDEDKSNWRDLFRVKSNRKAFMITFILGILQQLSGIAVVIFFATSIFTMAGSSIEPNVATIVIGVTQVVSSSIAPLFVERSGRRILLLCSSGLCSLALAILGIYFFMDSRDSASVQNIQWLPLASLVLFVLSFYMGFNVIPGTFIGEMFQSNVRSIGSAITVTSGGIFGFALSTAYNTMLDFLGAYGTFWFFSGVCALTFFFTMFFVLETRGKSLIEIQEMLSK